MRSVIIVAGGKGLRMGHDIPKQYIPINGIPVLMRTIDAFIRYDNTIRIIVVISPDYREFWTNLVCEYDFKIPHELVDGGDTRFYSVKNGLEVINGGFVAVHDAARPFVSTELIGKCFDLAMQTKAVIPVVDVTDSLREILSDDRSKIVDRSKFKLVQTPQVFETELLKKSYSIGFIDKFTDDASVVEHYGHPVSLVDGEKTNIKITTPFDLKLAHILTE